MVVLNPHARPSPSRWQSVYFCFWSVLDTWSWIRGGTSSCIHRSPGKLLRAHETNGDQSFTDKKKNHEIGRREIS